MKILKRLLVWLFLGGICLTIGVIAYGFILSIQIQQRFEKRRWEIPSKVYSTPVYLYPGQYFNPDELQEKLFRLNYTKTARYPQTKGSFYKKRQKFVIFLRPINLPRTKQDELVIEVAFKQGQIVSLLNHKTKAPIALAALEPELLMLIFGNDRENRQLISINKIPEHLIHAVLSAEDHEFFEHIGIDFSGIIRATLINLKNRSIRQGGSTITQQLIKNYFLTPERTVKRKVKELIMALVMELKYSKYDILEIYLNEIYFGQRGTLAVHGVGEAAQFYFNKSPQDLSVIESATLAGIIKAPNLFSPFKNPEKSQNRRNQVLKLMADHGWLDPDKLASLLDESIKTTTYRAYHKIAPYYMDYVEAQLKKLYSVKELTGQGLSIYTALDPQVQLAAEAVLKKGLGRLEKKLKHSPNELQGAIVVLQPQTGYVLALVGGRNYKTSQFNRITQAKRQPGSLFKPFVYLTALDTHTLAYKLSNIATTYDINGTPWTPQNYAEFPEKEVTIRRALAQSLNRPTIALAVALGLEKVVANMAVFQFSTKIKPYPSMPLGTFEMIPMELARAYAAFAAQGMLPFPLSIKGIINDQGQVLEQKHISINNVTTPEKAYLITSVLKSAVESGSAKSLKNYGIDFPVAGKTGTTNDFRDAWFVGYTPDLLVLVWVGKDNGDPVLASGSRAALPIWASLIKKIPQYTSKVDFQKPMGIILEKVCETTDELANENCCPKIQSEYVIKSKMNPERCSQHRCGSVFKNFLKEFKGIFKN